MPKDEGEIWWIANRDRLTAENEALEASMTKEEKMSALRISQSILDQLFHSTVTSENREDQKP